MIAPCLVWLKFQHFTLCTFRLMNLVAMETPVACLLSLAMLFTCAHWRWKEVLPVVLFHRPVCRRRGG